MEKQQYNIEVKLIKFQNLKINLIKDFDKIEKEILESDEFVSFFLDVILIKETKIISTNNGRGKNFLKII